MNKNRFQRESSRRFFLVFISSYAMALASAAPDLEAKPMDLPAPVPGKPRIAVARDRAFCFYYLESLRQSRCVAGREESLALLRRAADGAAAL